MKVLVTGATGFVGSAVARRYLRDGDEVVALVRSRERGGDLEREGASLHVGTVGDPNAVADAASGCALVIHAAAVASHRASSRALRWTNIAGTENVIAAARHARCERVVHVSCADVTLANVDRVHWNEDRALAQPPMDAHARSKLVAEDLALAASSSALEVTAVRPTTLWGAGDLRGVARLCREGLRSGIELPGGGKNLLAVTHIDNLVDAITSAAEVAKAAGRAYYVTDTGFHEARELFDALSKAIGLPPPRSVPYAVSYAAAWLRERRHAPGLYPSDVVQRGRSTLFDIQRAVTELDYAPTVDLPQGMEALRQWVEAQGGAAALAKLALEEESDASVEAAVRAAGGEIQADRRV